MIKSLNQMLPRISYGDATSSQALEIRNYLRKRGMASEIYVQDFDSRMKNEAKLISRERPEPGTGLIYHHSIGSEIAKIAMQHEGIKLCIYHNITPSVFFKNYDPLLQQYTELGRNQLPLIRDSVSFSFGDSEFNCQELREVGFSKVELLPIIVDPTKWHLESDITLTEKYGGNTTKNILFVGRIAPNKCQKELVRFFYFFSQVIPDSRLFLVGNYHDTDLYFQEVKSEIKRLNLEERVILSGHVSMEELKSYYQIADLFLSFSEHEGFGVPLIEAMWFDIPVVAYKSTAIPETLGEASFLLTSKEDLKIVALLVKHILEHNEIIDAIIDNQRKRRSAFLPDRIHPILERTLERIRRQNSK